MRPALHVVRFKYSKRFNPSVEQIHRRTERDFPTVQINTSHIYSTIPSSNRGIKQDKIILRCINIESGSDQKCELTTTRGLPYGIRQYNLCMSRAMTSPDHLVSHESWANEYFAASRLGKYPPLFTSTSVNNC